MTKNEALKLALDFITESNRSSQFWLVPASNLNKTVTAIREALAQPEQEPVAWLHTKIEGVAVPHRPADLDKHPDRWEALYKTPPPCPTCEALALTVMLDQTYHDAQRKPLPKGEWPKHPSGYVGDVYKGYDKSDLDNYAMQVLAAHGIKE